MYYIVPNRIIIPLNYYITAVKLVIKNAQYKIAVKVQNKNQKKGYLSFTFKMKNRETRF